MNVGLREAVPCGSATIALKIYLDAFLKPVSKGDPAGATTIIKDEPSRPEITARHASKEVTADIESGSDQRIGSAGECLRDLVEQLHIVVC